MTVIAAVDESPDADEIVRVADELATAFGEPLVVLTVLTEERFDRRQEQHDEYYRDDGAADARRSVQEIVDRVLSDDDHVEVVGRVGRPVTEVLAEAERRDARYLVIGGRKRTPVGKALFGSITQSILLEAELPVVTVMSEE